MQRKIIIAIILYVIVISATLGIISYLAVNESIKRSLNNKLALTDIIANYVETVLHSNLNRLYDISISGMVDLQDDDWRPEKRALKTAYDYSLFTDGVFLLDKAGNVLILHPHRGGFIENLTYIPYVNQVLQERRPVISNIYAMGPLNKRVIFAMVPLMDKEGEIVGVAGGIINPTGHFWNQMPRTVKVENNSYVQIIDFNEVVIASDNPHHLFKHHDHEGILRQMIKENRAGIKECPHGFSRTGPDTKQLDILAFTPLRIAPWGVIIGQAQEDVFAPSVQLKKKFLLLAAFFIITGLIFAIGLSISIAKPIRQLIQATGRIANGNLSEPVGNLGTYETLMLSKSFDIMRLKLESTLDSLKSYSTELEKRVMERTEQIRLERQKVETLLKQVISSQEDERKRIARELHDQTLQDISAVLMRIDMCRLYPEQISPQKIEEIRGITLKILDETRSIIQNLRPTLLDDIGLESAIRWLLDTCLRAKGINYFYNTEDIRDKRFSPEIEINIFRIAQEAINNIARHAEAENVFVIFKTINDYLDIYIEDDGRGFDIMPLPKSIYSNKGTRGLGITGMKERASLIDGLLQINSALGCGTRIGLKIPIKGEETKNV